MFICNMLQGCNNLFSVRINQINVHTLSPSVLWRLIVGAANVVYG